MSDCELIPTCPFYNYYFQEMSGEADDIKKEYCHWNYTWCGRYIQYNRIPGNSKLTGKSRKKVPAVKNVNSNTQAGKEAPII